MASPDADSPTECKAECLLLAQLFPQAAALPSTAAGSELERAAATYVSELQSAAAAHRDGSQIVKLVAVASVALRNGIRNYALPTFAETVLEATAFFKAMTELYLDTDEPLLALSHAAVCADTKCVLMLAHLVRSRALFAAGAVANAADSLRNICAASAPHRVLLTKLGILPELVVAGGTIPTRCPVTEMATCPATCAAKES